MAEQDSDRNYRKRSHDSKSRRDRHDESSHHHYHPRSRHNDDNDEKYRHSGHKRPTESKDNGLQSKDDKEKRQKTDDRKQVITNKEDDQGQQNLEQRPSWDNSAVKRQLEKIQERKKLWKGNTQESEKMATEKQPSSNNSCIDSGGKSKPIKPAEMGTSSASISEKKLETKWQSIIMASSSNTQQMDKFQRLMGLRKSMPSKEDTDQPASAEMQIDKTELERERSRQQNLQQDLGKQFEMARQTHHSARGRGLGSF